MVQRYEFDLSKNWSNYSDCHCSMEKSKDGEYVKYDDVIEALRNCVLYGNYDEPMQFIKLSDAIKAVEDM